MGQAGGFGREFAQFFGAQGVTAKELHIPQTQLHHLAQHGAGLGVQTAVKNRVRLLALDGRQDGHEVGGFVAGELLGHHVNTLLLRGGLEYTGHTLAIGGAVIDDGHTFDLQRIGGVQGQRCTQRVVVGDQAEGGGVAGFGQVRVGGRCGDVGHTTLGIKGRCRDGRTRLQVAHHTGNFGVTHLLRNRRGLAWVTRVVFCGQFKPDFLAADDEVLGVELFNGHAHAVFSVFADVGNTTGGGACMADFDDLHVLRMGGSSGQAQAGSGQGVEGESLMDERSHGFLDVLPGAFYQDTSVEIKKAMRKGMAVGAGRVYLATTRTISRHLFE